MQAKQKIRMTLNLAEMQKLMSYKGAEIVWVGNHQFHSETLLLGLCHLWEICRLGFLVTLQDELQP